MKNTQKNSLSKLSTLTTIAMLFANSIAFAATEQTISGSTITVSGEATSNENIVLQGSDTVTDLNFNGYNNNNKDIANYSISVSDFDKIYVLSGSDVVLGRYTATADNIMQIRGDSDSTYSKGNNLLLDNVTYNGTSFNSTKNEWHSLINFSYDSTTTVQNSKFDSNTLYTKGYGFLNGNYQESMYHGDSTANVINTTYSNNIVQNSGTSMLGVAMLYADYINVADSAFDGNEITLTNETTSTSLYSGVLKGSNTLKVENTSFKNNQFTVEKVGGTLFGGVTSGIGAKSSFTDVTFENNTSTSTETIQGGVIHLYGAGTMTIKDSAFIDNTATASGYATRGAAVTNYNGTFDISGTTFKNNSAVFNANAGYMADDGSGASGAEGGAIYAKKSTSSTTLTNVTFTGNSAELNYDASLADKENINARGGAIFLVDDASMTYNVTKNITNEGNYVSVNGVKNDEFGGFLYFGDAISDNGDTNSTATFDVSKGATLTIGNGTASYDSIASEDSTAVLNKAGAGSMVINSSMADYKGTLNVDGGEFALNNTLGASAINIESTATLAATINGNDTFSNSALKFSNDGTLKLVAGVGLASGSYSIAAADSIDFGTVSSFGGTYEGGNFVKGAVESVSTTDNVATFTNKNIKSNSNIEIKRADSDIVDVALSFNVADADSTTVATSAKDVTDTTSVSDDLKTLSAWDFAITLDEGDSVVLSYYIGTITDPSLLALYHIDNDGNKTNETDNIISYDGEYLVFEADDFSTWAASVQVPEPSTYAMIFGALALGLAVYRRRK